MSSKTTVVLTIAQPSFYIDSVGAVTLTRPSTNQTSIFVQGTNGFTGTVTVAVSGLPAGVTSSFIFNPIALSQEFSGGSVVLNLALSSTATLGKSTVTVTATSGVQSATTAFPITIIAQ
jgi:hypothetical protein